jgi:hypothetical protein
LDGFGGGAPGRSVALQFRGLSTVICGPTASGSAGARRHQSRRSRRATRGVAAQTL